MTFLIRERQTLNLSGFTLIDFLMMVTLLSILAVIVPAVSLPSIEEHRVERTRSRLLSIRRAILGDPSAKVRRLRTEFGFLGDMGRLPNALDELLNAPSGAGTRVQDPTARFAYGWSGPYLDTSDSLVEWTKDAWGRPIQYVVGNSVTATTIKSLGADGVAGGSGVDADLVIQIPPSATRFNLHGFVTDAGGGVFTGTGLVFLNDLDGTGHLASPASVSIGTAGYFVFQNVTMGRRSVFLTLPHPNPTATVGPVTVTPGEPHLILPARQLEAP
ncbi:MAG: type II secretion system protein GspG [Bdellovibrionales bacterium]|nr:type II secretion system protein GspG [Bdellovibrionales bacterium]